MIPVATTGSDNRGGGPVDREDRASRQALADRGHSNTLPATDLQQPIRRPRRNDLERPGKTTGQSPWRSRRQLIIR
ncbi:MAG: hypothetical protein IKE60_31350 [Reyranella sp.]|nr:hypothetical protein [Reyranella sp.]